jgi:hypothetical protein
MLSIPSHIPQSAAVAGTTRLFRDGWLKADGAAGRS